MPRSYDPLHFILLHHKGENGWSLELNGEGPDKVSQIDFYAYRLMVRPGDFDMLLRAGRLMQEYVVDAFCKIQEARLQFTQTTHQRQPKSMISLFVRSSLILLYIEICTIPSPDVICMAPVVKDT